MITTMMHLIMVRKALEKKKYKDALQIINILIGMEYARND